MDHSYQLTVSQDNKEMIANDSFSISNTQELDARIVEYVKNYPNLYDKRLTKFRDVKKREECWAEIGTALDVPAPFVLNRWVRIRERYCRERKAMDRDKKRKSPWHLYNKMGFLAEHIKKRMAVRYERMMWDKMKNNTNKSAVLLTVSQESDEESQAIGDDSEKLTFDELERSEDDEDEFNDFEDEMSDDGVNSGDNYFVQEEDFQIHSLERDNFKVLGNVSDQDLNHRADGGEISQKGVHKLIHSTDKEEEMPTRAVKLLLSPNPSTPQKVLLTLRNNKSKKSKDAKNIASGGIVYTKPKELPPSAVLLKPLEGLKRSPILLSAPSKNCSISNQQPMILSTTPTKSTNPLTPIANSAEYHFGMLIARELETLPPHRRSVVKQKILRAVYGHDKH